MVGKARQDLILKLKFGSFEFDPRRHELRRNGFRIKLAASQLRLLTLFLERNGELVTREQIAARLWVDTRNIDVSTGINTAINRLRRHLQEAPGAPSAIETVGKRAGRSLLSRVSGHLIYTWRRQMKVVAE